MFDALADIPLLPILSRYRTLLAPRQAVFPLSFLGSFIIPVLWTATPHARAHGSGHAVTAARWLVWAVCAALDAAMLWGRYTSPDVVIGYGQGLVAVWAVFMAFRFIVVGEPQREAARVVRVKRGVMGRRGRGNEEGGGGERGGAKGTGVEAGGDESLVEGTMLRNRLLGKLPSENGAVERRFGDDATPPDTEVTGYEPEFEYYWQPFPADAPFRERWNWALDLFTSVRGTGWNWCIHAVPHPPPPSSAVFSPQPPPPSSSSSPSSAAPLEPVDVSSIPLRTRHGYTVQPTPAAFLRTTYTRLAICFLLCDFLSTLIRHDPYFTLGPAYRTALPTPLTLPPLLASLPPWALALYRSNVFFVCVLAALNAFLSVHDLLQYHLLSRLFPARRAAWWHPSHFGSFDAVLDRGLAGFWGSWWHQSFRVVFTAPAEYLIRSGLVAGPKSRGARLANLVFPFLVSASLHAGASHMAPGPTPAWRPFAYFASASVGVGVQQLLCVVLMRVIATLSRSPRKDNRENRDNRDNSKPPRWLRRTGNLAFAVVWMNATSWIFMDDMTSSGFMAFEPTPVSLARILGLGREGEGVWRGQHGFWWHWRGRWWETGLAL